MSEIKFTYSDNRDVEESLPAILDHMFSTSLDEAARQQNFDVLPGILTRSDCDITRTRNRQKRIAMRADYERRLRERHIPLSELGCFEIVIEYDETDPHSLDVALQALVLSLAEWANHTDTLVAYCIHLAQDDGKGTRESVHMHVLWNRRRGEKLYRDNMLQWYLHAMFQG